MLIKKNISGNLDVNFTKEYAIIKLYIYIFACNMENVT